MATFPSNGLVLLGSMILFVILLSFTYSSFVGLLVTIVGVLLFMVCAHQDGLDAIEQIHNTEDSHV